MPASDEFKKALRSGDLPEAFVMAMGKATELNITTKVIKADGTVDEEFNAAQCLETRLDILNGTIENRVGEEFVGKGKYRELQEFHQQQVALGNRKIQENFQSLQELFRLLVTLQQYNRLTNAEQPLDLTFLEVPSQKLPPERVITTLQEQASVLESLQEDKTFTVPEEISASIPQAELGDDFEPTTNEPIELIAPPPPHARAKQAAKHQEQTHQTTPSETADGDESATNVDRGNGFQGAAIATGVVAATVAVAKSVTPERQPQKSEDDEPLDFLDSFAALDLDEAPEPLMPVSEVEIDDWETPTEMSPAERLAQTPSDAYIPTLSDFDHDDDHADGLDDLLDDDLDDLLEDETPALVEENSSIEPATIETIDKFVPDDEEEAIALDEPDTIEPDETETLDLTAAGEAFDVDELPDFADDNLDELLIDSFSEDESQIVLESPETEGAMDDTDDFSNDEFPDFSEANLDNLFVDSEVESEAIAGFDDFSEDDLPDEVVDDLLNEDDLLFHELDTSSDDSEVTAISFKQKSQTVEIPQENELATESDNDLDDLLEDEVAIAPEAALSDPDGLTSNFTDLTDIGNTQAEGLVASELIVSEVTAPQDTTTPSEAIADEPEAIVDNELLIAANAMTPAVTAQVLKETLEQNDATPIAEASGPDSPPAVGAAALDLSTLDDSELLSFIDENWHSHPEITEITSLDADADDDPLPLQPLSEEELATLEEVEDIDWLSSTVDDDWEPLNLSGDETKGLESFSLSLSEAELAVDAEMTSMVAVETEAVEAPTLTTGVDNWQTIDAGLNGDSGNRFNATAGLPEIDLGVGELDSLEPPATGLADAAEKGAIADEFTAEAPANSDDSLATDDLATIADNIEALKLAGTEVDQELDTPLDSDNWDASAINPDTDALSAIPLEIEPETFSVDFDDLEDLDESSDLDLLDADALEMATDIADDTAIENDTDLLAGIDTSALADLSDEELDTRNLDDDVSPASLGRVSSDLNEPELDPFATANLAATDLEMLSAEVDLDFEAMEEEVELDLSVGTIGELASPDPLVLENDAFDELAMDADFVVGIDELATPVFDMEPDPFAEVDLDDEEFEPANLDDLDVLETTDLPDILDDRGLDQLDLDADITVDNGEDEGITPVFEMEPDPFAELDLGDEGLELANLDDFDALETTDLPDALGDSELDLEADIVMAEDEGESESATPVFEMEPDPFAELDLDDEKLATTDLDSFALSETVALTKDRPATVHVDKTTADLDFDDLDLELDGLGDLDLDDGAIALAANDEAELLQDADIVNELNLDAMADNDGDAALGMDPSDLDSDILASLSALDQATQDLETSGFDFGSEALLDDLGHDLEAELANDDLAIESGALFTDDDMHDGSAFDREPFSLDSFNALEEAVTAGQPESSLDVENFADLDLELDVTAEVLPELPEEAAIAPETTSDNLSTSDDDWANFDLDFDPDDSLADLAADDDSGDLDDAPIRLDFDLGDLDLPDMEIAETADEAIATSDNDDSDWQQFAFGDDEIAITSSGDDGGWGALKEHAATSVDLTNGMTASNDDDDWAIAGLDGLDDLSDNDLGGLGDFDLDVLELDDDQPDNSDFDLLGDDESGNLNPFLDPSV